MTDKEIRSILAPLTDGYILLPNSAVGEILNFTSPEPFKQGPAWLLGEIAWRGWQVPVINYERLLKDGSGTKITSDGQAGQPQWVAEASVITITSDWSFRVFPGLRK